MNYASKSVIIFSLNKGNYRNSDNIAVKTNIVPMGRRELTPLERT